MTEYTSYHRGVTSTDGNQYIRFYLGSGIKLRSSAEPFLRRQDVLNQSHMTAITSVPGLLHSLGTSLHQQHLFSRFLSNNFFLKRSSGFPALISQYILFLFTASFYKRFFSVGRFSFLGWALSEAGSGTRTQERGAHLSDNSREDFRLWKMRWEREGNQCRRSQSCQWGSSPYLPLSPCSANY